LIYNKPACRNKKLLSYKNLNSNYDSILVSVFYHALQLSSAFAFPIIPQNL